MKSKTDRLKSSQKIVDVTFICDSSSEDCDDIPEYESLWESLKRFKESYNSFWQQIEVFEKTLSDECDD